MSQPADGVRHDPAPRMVLPYVLAGVLAAAACQTWFRPGRFIATGDIPPLLGSGVHDGSTALWGHSLGGAGRPSYQISGFIPALLSGVVERLGGSDLLAQRLLYTVLFTGAAVGVAYFAAGFTRRPAAVLVAGVVGVFNPYLMTSVPNPVTLLALGVSAALGGMVVRAARGHAASPIWFAAATLGWSYVAQNPPFLVLGMLWVVVVALSGSALVGPGGTRRAMRLLLRATPWALVMNLWWLVPAAITLGGGAGVAAVTDVREWVWTHARSSLVNVLRLNAGWGWDYEEYFPYSASLDQPVLVAASLVVPVVCLSAPLLTRGRARRTSAVLALTVLGVVVLGTGLHAPLGTMNQWLFDHVPGYWLFREPAAKLGVPLVLLYGALLALVTEAVLDRRRLPGGRQLAVVGLVGTLAAVAASSYPLWTGRVIPDDRSVLPSAHVALPDEWRAAAEFVNGARQPGKALVLPLADFYQMPTTWGYYGTDVIAESLVRRPAVTRPGGYLEASPGFRQLVEATEKALLLGDVALVPRLLQSLGVSHVLLRHDFDRDFPGRRIPDPNRLAAGLRDVPGLRMARPSPVVSVYEVGGRTGMVQAYSDVVEARGSLATALVATAPPNQAVVAADSAPGRSRRWTWVGQADRSVLRLPSAGVYRTVVTPASTALYVVRSATSESGRSLSLSPVEGVSLGGRELPVPGRNVIPLPERAVAVRIGDELVPLSNTERVVSASGETPVELLGPTAAASPITSFGAVADCYAVDSHPPSVTGISVRAIEGEPTGMELRARSHSACVSAELGRHTPGTAYRLRFDYRGVAGDSPRACLWQSGVDRCATLPPLERSAGWTGFDALVNPAPGTEELTLFFYADGAEPIETVTQYRAATFERLKPLDAPTALNLRSTTTDLTLSTGPQEVRTRRSSGMPKLEPFSPVEDCHAYDDMTAGAAGLRAEPLRAEPQPAVRLRARHHSACVEAAVDAFAGPEPYRLSFSYRTRTGEAARTCLWQEGLDRCVPMDALERSRSWERFEATVTPELGTTGLRIFLYADGTGKGETVTEYRGVRLTPASSYSVVVSPLVKPATVPLVTVEEQSPERHSLRLRGGRGPFMLVLADSFHPGWKIKGLPKGTRAVHLAADGYANGWLIDGPVQGRVVIEFEPGEAAEFARRGSLAGGLAAIGAVAIGRGRRRLRSVPSDATYSPSGGSAAEDVADGPTRRSWLLGAGVALLVGAVVSVTTRRPAAADALLLASFTVLAAGYAGELSWRRWRKRGPTFGRAAGAMPTAGSTSPTRSAHPRPTSHRSRRRNRARRRAQELSRGKGSRAS